MSWYILVFKKLCDGVGIFAEWVLHLINDKPCPECKGIGKVYFNFGGQTYYNTCLSCGGIGYR